MGAACVVALGLGGCETVLPRPLEVVAVPDRDALYQPARINPGRLEYAPDRTTFAPILTNRVPYPTQPQANAAYLRLLMDRAPDPVAPRSVRLFGCRPGLVDEQTARIAKTGRGAVHCASEFLDDAGAVRFRQPVNFVYRGGMWVMGPVEPPQSLAFGRPAEPSPRDVWRWLPFRDRYQ